MNFTKKQQEKFIRMAMEQTEQSIREGHSPFGAVLVDELGTVVKVVHNTVSKLTDRTSHAELNMIRYMAREKGMYYLSDYAIFVNATSCAMCAAALIRVGMRDFYFGAHLEPHANPAISFEQLAQYTKEPISFTGGILAEECMAQIERGRKQNVRI
jgi:tRNA(adenine34) deaminase